MESTIQEHASGEKPELSGRYSVALTADAARADGSTLHGDIGLERLTNAGIPGRKSPHEEPASAPWASAA